uniref:Uncharacterized protein n=1 Tax=Arundo donax TaxID=35708 RepID=A0A0A8YQ68_ARUDO
MLNNEVVFAQRGSLLRRGGHLVQWNLDMDWVQVSGLERQINDYIMMRRVNYLVRLSLFSAF